MTPISQYGEFKLIEHITKGFPVFYEGVLKRVGDDAAVVRAEKGSVSVFSTDLLLEGIHFDLAYVPLKHLGYKAVVVNLSDIFAMNAVPYGITVGIAFSNRFPVEAIEELYDGIRAACSRYGIELLGGDTSSSRQGLIISITAYGTAEADDITYRNGAKPNDLVCVTGDLGGAYAGFLVLEREKKTFLANPDLQPELLHYDYVVSRQLKPENKPALLQAFKNLEIKPTAMIDISDGLANELHHLCGQSKCGVTIYADKLPIDYQTVNVAEEFDISPTTFALNGGEDYEMLFTIDIGDFQKIKGMEGVTIIGHVTPEEGALNIVISPTQITPIIAQGFRHF